MALTKPILNNMVAYDVADGATFTFNSVGGNQVTSNRLIIKDVITLNIVYNVTIESFKFEHIVPPNIALMSNGTQYQAQIQTLDSQGNESPLSDTIQFWCYTNPVFQFSNMPIGNIIENSSFSFDITYSQIQGELLNSYIYNLYNIGGTSPISTSGILYTSQSESPIILTYLFTGFNNSTSYEIECSGVTMNGTPITTGRVSFSVFYIRPSVFTLMELTNVCNEGYINIQCNIVSIDGKSNPDPPKYIDDKEVDLRTDGNWVLWNTGFNYSGDFTMGIWGRDFNLYKQILQFSDIQNNRFLLNYQNGYADGDRNTTLMAYIELYVINESSNISYYVYSNYIELPVDTEQQFIYTRRIGDLYDLKLTNRGVVI